MLKELDDLIERILLVYEDVSGQWVKSEKYLRVNLKKTCVSRVQKEAGILDLIWAYRNFIEDNGVIANTAFELNKFRQTISIRIKTQNSIEYKIEKYIFSREKGMVPVNKCLNDLVGIRVFISDDVSHKNIREHIDDSYPKLKCIDSSKDDYIATHIYFKTDNFSFPWELQIWRTEDRENNLKSHKQYKQEYIKWENSGGRDV